MEKLISTSKSSNDSTPEPIIIPGLESMSTTGPENKGILKAAAILNQPSTCHNKSSNNNLYNYLVFQLKLMPFQLFFYSMPYFNVFWSQVTSMSSGSWCSGIFFLVGRKRITSCVGIASTKPHPRYPCIHTSKRCISSQPPHIKFQQPTRKTSSSTVLIARSRLCVNGMLNSTTPVIVFRLRSISFRWVARTLYLYALAVKSAHLRHHSGEISGKDKICYQIGRKSGNCFAVSFNQIGNLY